MPSIPLYYEKLHLRIGKHRIERSASTISAHTIQEEIEINGEERESRISSRVEFKKVNNCLDMSPVI